MPTSLHLHTFMQGFKRPASKLSPNSAAIASNRCLTVRAAASTEYLMYLVGSQVPSSCLCSILNAKSISRYLDALRCPVHPSNTVLKCCQLRFGLHIFFVFVFATSLPCLVAISRRNTHTVPNAIAVCHSRLLPTRVKSRTQSIPVSSLVVLLLLRNQSYTWSSNPRLSNNKMISCTIDRTFCVSKSTVRSGLEGTS